jgi:lipoprotein-releasing system permease protein
MGYPLTLARRYLASKKRNMISISTSLAIGGVTLGVAALAIVMSVTGGFQEQFREKVLGVNAHVLVLKYSIDFREYREVMKKVEHVKGVVGVAPFVINPMMVTHADRTATGVLLKGVDPELMTKVLDLPKHIVEGDLKGMRRAGAKPPERTIEPARNRLLPGTTGDAGAASAGSLLGAMRQSVERDMAALEAGAPRVDLDAGVAGARAHAPPTLPTAGAPVGDITPDGGYKSELPDTDDIPDSIDPDPCKSPEQVASMAGVVVGRTLAKQLAITIGDCVQVTSPTIGLSYGASSRPPIAKQFRVIAVFEAGFDQYDSKLVYTDLYEAQAFYEYGDSVTGVEMKVDDIDRAHAIAREIDGLLANGVYHTMDWRELNHGLFTALLIQQIGMSAVLFLIIVVAAFQVIATLTMIVLEKKKNIALLKALGASDDAILRTFLYQGAFLGLVGTSLGLAIGIFVCRVLLVYGFPLDPKVYFISSLPVSMDPVAFTITGLGGIVACVIATIFPAVYASRLRPSDGLRSE